MATQVVVGSSRVLKAHEGLVCKQSAGILISTGKMSAIAAVEAIIWQKSRVSPLDQSVQAVLTCQQLPSLVTSCRLVPS